MRLVGKAYALKLAAQGGNLPYKDWAVTPALPAPLALNPLTGEITGTPGAAAASAAYTFEVSDLTGTKVTKTLNFVVTSSMITTAALSGWNPRQGIQPEPRGGRQRTIHCLAGHLRNAARGHGVFCRWLLSGKPKRLAIHVHVSKHGRRRHQCPKRSTSTSSTI